MHTRRVPSFQDLNQQVKTFAAMVTFMLAMVRYPDVQKRAQAELDSVVGAGRLPDFEDRNSLPYVTAVCKEVHRWHPALPQGVARRLMQDDSLLLHQFSQMLS